jgi:hypothetical protein
MESAQEASLAYPEACISVITTRIANAAKTAGKLFIGTSYARAT